ncbi:2-hydroxyacid dehydrogenase [Parasphingorhabdus sp. DH2-15]|uniref:2-hydroxyacid dehydrogenase n=1 Tax=Parasphingorhabdus sp. DH2-15 TaxID=3444112 RepID=UPI003F685C35
MTARSCKSTKIIVTRALAPAVEKRLDELFDVTLNSSDTALTTEQLRNAMQECDVLLATVTDHLTADIFAQDNLRCKLLANFGAGVDHIDLKAARAAGVMVTNTPGVFTDDTADMTMALILSVPRRLAEGEKLVRSGEWQGWSPSGMLGHCIGGKTLGIIGMGRIGQAVAHRARAFGLNICYHNRRKLPDSFEKMLDATYVENLDELVQRSDFITLHCPKSDDTKHILNAERIAMLRPDAYVINTARGELIDEDALINALQNQKIAGAGLDVYTNEPAVDPRLLDLRNVVLLPHLGSATFEGREASGHRVISNIHSWCDGHRPHDQVLDGWM